MKRIHWLTLLVLLTVAPLEFLPGCMTPTQQKVAVNTLATIHEGADAAFKGYLDAVLSGQASTNGVPRVSNAYREFQRTFAAAVELVALNTNAVAPASVLNANARLLQSIAKEKGSSQ